MKFALTFFALLLATLGTAAEPSLEQLQDQAQQGDPAAQLSLAIRYRDAKGVAKDDAVENLYILCNPAVATPGLQLITSDDLKDFWRSDYYGARAKAVLSRPAFVIESR